MSDIKIDWIQNAVIAVGAIVSTLFILWRRSQGEEAVRLWAEEQGFTILESSRPFFVPHWRTTFRKRCQFFRVSVRDKQGSIRWAWIRCSVWDFADPKDMDMEVIWDEN